MLRAHKISQQAGLNRVFGEQGRIDEVVTASAYCQARVKVKAELFVALNDAICEEMYEVAEADAPLKLWHGHRLVAIDGSPINLPDTREMRSVFTVQHNQSTDYVVGMMMVMHDLLNDFGLSASLGPVAAEANAAMSDAIWRGVRAGDVICMDRGFCAYAIIAKAVKSGCDVIIRCPRSGFAIVKEFFDSPAIECQVTLNPYPYRRAAKATRQHDLPKSVHVRLVKVQLPSGETEVLLTTLNDAQRYPAAALKTAYAARYPGQESYFNRLKNIFDLERFSGRSVLSVLQDFHGIIFLTNLESVLIKPAQRELGERIASSAATTRPSVNRVISYIALIDRVVALLSRPDVSVPQIIDDVTHLLLRSPTHHRPERVTPRTDYRPSAEPFLRYRKRLT